MLFITSSATPTPGNINGDYFLECSSKEKQCVINLIEKYSKEYNYPTQLAKDIAYCESEYKPTALGDSGKAYGIYQFHKNTFNLFSKEKGEVLDYYNTEDNIKLAIWALANDKENHWTCYKKVASR